MTVSASVINTPIQAALDNAAYLRKRLDVSEDDHLFNWSPEVFVASDLSAGSDDLNDATSYPRLHLAGVRWVIQTNTGLGRRFYSHHRGIGLGAINNADTARLVAPAAGGADVVLMGRRDSSKIVMIDQSDGQVYVTTNWDTYTNPGAVGHSGHTIGLYFNGSYYVAKDVSGTDLVVHVATEADLGTWNELSIATTAQFIPRRAVAGSDRFLLLPQSGGKIARWTSASGLEEIAVPISGVAWRGAYSEHLGRFVIVCQGGALYLSDDATASTWSSIAEPGFPYVWGSTNLQDVVSSGRGFVVNATNTLYFVDQDHAGAWRFRVLPIGSADGSSSAIWHLLRHRGRVIAGRVKVPAAENSRLEWWTSGCCAADINENGV